ncbi:TspO/MBR family protein [Zunongwangia sp. F363]|uniref:TspO/MBR family protein n=1 Tax=Autumnicola tepida TaxID=3075595 RepID=A0ABU3C4J6_9FLAO|nr:TspO/MBR family protein [Zunongwangia sp. F363]MDT0641272.1 TspO/MBR family protein [Zunongwangia sp. F363]
MSHKLLIRSTIAVTVCLLFGFLSGIATEAGIYEWYPELQKPWFNPPQWTFAPFWLIMYIVTGIAAGLVWHKGFYHKWVKVALYHFGFQLLLSAFWSILFFGLHRPFWALLDILILLVLVLITIKWFRFISGTATALMLPYLIWIVFVTAITFEVWRLNFL